MAPFSLLIIDDHPVFRDALTEKLSQVFAPQGAEVLAVGSAHEGLDAIAQPGRKWIVLLDLLLPGLSGLAGVKVFKAHPHVDHVVAISGLDERLWEPKSVAAGAAVFLSKSKDIDQILRKLGALLQARPGEPAAGLGAPPPEFRLTARQREVLTLIAQGHANKAIAGFLEISEQTVKIHINQIFKELRVFNRTQAVLKAQKNHLL